MYLRSLTAGVIAAALSIAGATAAGAADIFRPDDPALSESPYDDPRYADIYKDPEPPLPPRYGPPSDYERYEEPAYEGPRRWNRYGEGEYLAPIPRRPSFDDYRPRRALARPGCVPRHEVRHELIRDGWSELHDVEIRNQFVFMTARRPNGLLYRLKVDRCDGQIVRARRIEHGEDAYAWRRREIYPSY